MEVVKSVPRMSRSVDATAWFALIVSMILLHLV
jgi:hypothetical protein